jgi:hypothetical protein
LHSRSFGEFAVCQFYDAVADYAFEFLWGAPDGRVARRHMAFASVRVGGQQCPPHAVFARTVRASAFAFVHGLVGQAVGFLVVFAEGVAYGEPFQLGD